MIPWLHISLPQLKGSDRYLNLLVKLLSIRGHVKEMMCVRVCVSCMGACDVHESVCVSCMGACDVRESVCVVYGCM